MKLRSWCRVNINKKLFPYSPNTAITAVTGRTAIAEKLKKHPLHLAQSFCTCVYFPNNTLPKTNYNYNQNGCQT